MRLFLLRFFTFAGLLLSLYLVYQHYNFVTGGDTEKGICAIVQSSRCTAIEASGFSEFFGVPTASYGAFYFLVFELYLLLGRRGRGFGGAPIDRSPFMCGAVFLTAIGLISSIVLASISAFVIRAFCIGCSTVYFITLLNAVIAGGFDPVAYVGRAVAGFRDFLDFLKRLVATPRVSGAGPKLSLTLLLLLIVAPLNFAAPVYFTRKAQRLYSAHILQRYEESKFHELKVRPASIVHGPEDAPVQIFVFTDFECPHCKIFNEALRKSLEKFPRDYWRVVEKHYPLDPKCNPVVEKYLAEGKSKYQHPRACEVSAMVQAFTWSGKTWEYFSRFYEVQNKPELYPVLKKIAEDAGVDYAEWAARSKDVENLREVILDVGEGLGLGVSAIPAVFINGRYVPSVKPQDVEFIMRVAPTLKFDEPPAEPPKKP